MEKERTNGLNDIKGLTGPSGHHKQPRKTNAEKGLYPCPAPMTASSVGVSSAAGASVAKLAPLAGAFMPLAICKACVESVLESGFCKQN